MVKLIGCGLILLAGVLHIYDFRTKERAAIRNLREYIKLVEHVGLQIGYFSHPVIKILDDYHSLLGKTIEEIQETLTKNTILQAEEIQVLFEWGRAVGNGYKNEQLNLCAYTKEKLDQYLSKREKDYPVKAKTNSALTLLAVASLIVLLI